MRQDIQVLDRVKSAYASLRPSERRVADYVLSDPDECTQCTISELADMRSSPPCSTTRCWGASPTSTGGRSSP